MSTYIPAYKGYITDVPEIWFKRRDGKVFHYDQLTAANATPNVNFTEVNAGWSLFPVAYLPGQSTMEFQFTSGQFNADLFAMANNKDYAEDAAYSIMTTKELDVVANKATFAAAKLPDDLLIVGLEKSEGEPTEGKYKATFTTDHVELEFNPGDVGDTVEVTYTETATANVIKIDNQTSAVGEMIAKWPIYASGDETDAAGIKGHVYMKIYRCRCTAAPGFDTSYKSAATNQVTFSCMDAKREDGNVYEIAYVPKV